MFFAPRIWQKNGTRLCFSADTKCLYLKEEKDGIVAFLSETVERRLLGRAPTAGAVPIKTLTFALGMPSGQAGVCGEAEEYSLTLGEDCFVHAQTHAGLLYGLATLMQLVQYDEMEGGYLYDRPDCPVRGYRLFLPGADRLDEFMATLDFLQAYRYNAVILEIGGAMEYRRHPEINDWWRSFCREVRETPGRAAEIQHGTYPFAKNSIHCDNGNGGVLSQEICRVLAAACRARGLAIIPECPTLCHADYLLGPHPELRERAEDAYADSYCPRAPGVYDLVFDVLDEVLDVFAPAALNIGHDEAYSLGICPRCRNIRPLDLYVEDVRRIKAHLDSRGVATWMWGEKLLLAEAADGRMYGGNARPAYCNGQVYVLPELYQCRDMLPQGITYLHWYWGMHENSDRVYHDRHMPMVFGNLSVAAFRHWRKRIRWGARGGFVSNWGSLAPLYMQRNCQTTSLLFASYAFWSATYDDAERDALQERVADEAQRLALYGKGHLRHVRHTTNVYIPYKVFYDGVFIDPAVYRLGCYHVTWEDGSQMTFPVDYGTTITCRCAPLAADTVRPEDGFSVPCDSSFYEVCGAARPYNTPDGIWCEWAFENPHPDKKIVSFTFEPAEGRARNAVLFERLDF